ncbi:class I SAM-dependent methyltransferase [Paraconexibacter antarcticus]|uniref:Class I SAM-dependent methyltransferase n=1 Tax=Paraconexibacter antarcticus TaxID=2949664 RepID=A0ABY5DLA8_9ACTN|nr:class I SAM-dependent methyltransferase [Paraconexibacter antarcticus]UTI62603.1 class I SAM-dependent methyltransferase [Paraconexibacter antarcticus]
MSGCPESTRKGITRQRAIVRGLGQMKANQALLAKRVADLELALEPGPSSLPEVAADDRFPPDVRSRICTQAQLREPWFAAWCARLGEPPLAHRKTWEFAYVGTVLEALGMLEPGRRALGFGVGREPLVSGFAGAGVEVVATDLAPDAREARGWVRSDQHAAGVEGLLRPAVCERTTFRELVSWRPVDMRAIPGDLEGFDFCWSICSLEHLGSLDAGIEFIEASVATLKPGGYAVHTTEFNLHSDGDTVESGPTVIYRRRDLHALKDRLERAGHEVAAFELDPGAGLLDHYVDVPPYADEPVLRFLFASYTLTSVAIVVRAAPA